MSYIGKQPFETPSSFTAVASGALSNGDLVCVNSDGTVSVAASTGLATDPAYGDPVEFETGNTYYTSSAYDTQNDKIVIAYQDDSNIDYGTAVVGTVSGDTITFGTPVIFISSDTIYTRTVYDSNAQKVVIAFADNTNQNDGKAVVGTVSGTSISFGTVVTFANISSGVIYPNPSYDSSAQKVLMMYTNSNAYNGIYNTMYGKVGTISGTSISFGSEAHLVNNASCLDPSIAYDSNSNKHVAVYEDSTNSEGKAVVLTVSGTSVSAGTPVAFSSTEIGPPAVGFDSTANKMVIAYRDVNNSNYGTGIVGTVSGTSISFGTASVFHSNYTTPQVNVYAEAQDLTAIWCFRINVLIDGVTTTRSAFFEATLSGTSLTYGDAQYQNDTQSLPTNGTWASYDPDQEKVILSYRGIAADGYDGFAQVYSPTGDGPNIANFIGIANKSAVDGGDASIQLTGSVDSSQSGLTAGQKYYVQSNNTLSTTPDAFATVVAGVALSAAEIAIDTGRD